MLQTSAKTPLPPQSQPTRSHSELVEVAQKMRLRVEELIKSKGTEYGFYPRFNVGVKGKKVISYIFMIHFSFFLVTESRLVGKSY